MRKVREVMNENLKMVLATTPLPELVSIFSDQGMTGAPVVDHEGRLVGVVSRSDVARQWVESSALPTPRNAQEFMAQDIMTPFSLDVSPEDELDKVVDLMVGAGVHRVIVTLHHKPVGIVTTMDLMKDYRRLLFRENNRA